MCPGFLRLRFADTPASSEAATQLLLHFVPVLIFSIHGAFLSLSLLFGPCFFTITLRQGFDYRGYSVWLH